MKALIFTFLLLTAVADAQDLPRRGSAGLMVATTETGVVVRSAFPNLAAANAGLMAEDVITSVDGKPVKTTAEFVATVTGRKVGEKLRIAYMRAGEARTTELSITPFPYERSDDFDVVYSHVSADNHRYRTILTKPKGNGPFPALFIVQGVGCGSIDNPPPGGGYSPLVTSLTKRGYATLRVDKPGAGDSEGGPCPAVDFPTEVRAYEAALASLKTTPGVDAKNVFLFGHSMGGFMAPLMADVLPLRGVIVYGSGFNSWISYILENQRRQMRLGNADFVEIANEEKASERLASLFYIQKLPLEKIVAEHPEYRERFPDGKTYAAGKHGKYFQQLYDLNMAKEWKAANVPVLSIWGTADFVSNEADHEWLAAAVNSFRPGTARFLRLQGTDHWLRKAADQAASMNAEQTPGPEPEYNEAFTDAVVAFMTERVVPR